MTNKSTEVSPLNANPWQNPFSLVLGFALLFVVVCLGFLGFWFGMRTGTAQGQPGSDSPEAGFARDMAAHHAQAVNMATLLRDNTDDPEMRQIALDIMLTQQAQIGQMQGWLNIWKLPLAGIGPAMAWMGMPTTDPMPGMATPGDINRLRGLKGIEADGLFLSLMIPHHRGGVTMSQAILERSKRSEVIALAQAIVKAQESEIALMQALLQRKGFPAVPDEPSADHGTMTP
jgi:uncharacterized protein (DUF305 family)